MAVIDYLKSGNDYLYPVTVTQAVYRPNGTNLELWMDSHIHPIYAVKDHDHDADYSKLGHNHDTLYSKASHTHEASQISGMPIALKNPYGLTISMGENIVYDGSSAKTVTITAAAIGAAPKSHTHTMADITGGGGAGGGKTLTVSFDGNMQVQFNGSEDKSLNITPVGIGAAAVNHTHSYLPLSGGTITGNIDMPFNRYIQFKASNVEGSGGLIFLNSKGEESGEIKMNCDSSGNVVGLAMTVNNGKGLAIENDSLYFNGFKVTTGADNGEGGGINADMLDGKHAIEFITVDHGKYGYQLNPYVEGSSGGITCRAISTANGDVYEYTVDMSTAFASQHFEQDPFYKHLSNYNIYYHCMLIGPRFDGYDVTNKNIISSIKAEFNKLYIMAINYNKAKMVYYSTEKINLSFYVDLILTCDSVYGTYPAP